MRIHGQRKLIKKFKLPVIDLIKKQITKKEEFKRSKENTTIKGKKKTNKTDTFHLQGVLKL